MEGAVHHCSVRRSALVVGDPVGDERGAHAEDGIGVQVLVAVTEDVGDQARVPGRAQHVVQVGGAPGVATPCFEHGADRGIVRDGIGVGQDGLEVVTPFAVGGQLAAGTVRVFTGCCGWALNVVEAVFVGLPDVHGDARERGAVGGGHTTADEAGFTARTIGNV